MPDRDRPAAYGSTSPDAQPLEVWGAIQMNGAAVLSLERDQVLAALDFELDALRQNLRDTAVQEVDERRRAAAGFGREAAAGAVAPAAKPPTYTPDGTPSIGWIGVDFDGTLAEYHGWVPELGAPVPAMVARVKAWRAEGVPVRIVTARVASEDHCADQILLIEAWCREHIGEVLPITATKDPAMLELWDDRAVTVEPNTGRVICHPAGEWTP